MMAIMSVRVVPCSGRTFIVAVMVVRSSEVVIVTLTEMVASFVVVTTNQYMWWRWWWWHHLWWCQQTSVGGGVGGLVAMVGKERAEERGKILEGLSTLCKNSDRKGRNSIIQSL